MGVLEKRIGKDGQRNEGSFKEVEPKASSVRNVNPQTEYHPAAETRVDEHVRSICQMLL